MIRNIEKQYTTGLFLFIKKPPSQIDSDPGIDVDFGHLKSSRARLYFPRSDLWGAVLILTHTWLIGCRNTNKWRKPIYRTNKHWILTLFPNVYVWKNRLFDIDSVLDMLSCVALWQPRSLGLCVELHSYSPENLVLNENFSNSYSDIDFANISSICLCHRQPLSFNVNKFNKVHARVIISQIMLNQVRLSCSDWPSRLSRSGHN